MNNNEKDFNDVSLHELLQRISQGTFDPKHLPKEDRQALVQVLLMRGQEQIAIARLMKVTDRTIRRYVRDIWDQNALNRDPEFTKKFVGLVYLKAMSFVETLTRLGHSSDGKMSERSQAMYLAWRSLKEFIEIMQSLGYLPFDQRRMIPPKEPGKEKPDKKELKNMELDKKEDAIKWKLQMLHPQEREKMRRDLVKEIIEMSKLENNQTPPESENPSDKEYDDPGTAGVAAAT